MVVSGLSTVVSFDAETALGAAREAADGALHLAIEFDASEFNTLYADEQIVNLYGSTEAMVDHFGKVHSYVHIDFTEQQMFEDVLFAAGSVRAFTAHMEYVTAVRVLVGHEGMFLGLEPDAPVSAIIEAMEDALEPAS